MANNEHDIKTYPLIDKKSIAASGSFTSDIINLEDIKAEGNITIQVEVTGTGTATIEFEQSNSFNTTDLTGDFVKPSSGSSIVTGFTVTSGSGSNGKDLFNVPAFNSKVLRMVITETGTANAIIVSMWVSIQ